MSGKIVKKDQKEQESLTRIAIVSNDRCKPKKCRQECKKSCPVVRMGKLCIEAASDSKIAYISEELCIGCGICVKVSETMFLIALFLLRWRPFLMQFQRNAHLKPFQL